MERLIKKLNEMKLTKAYITPGNVKKLMDAELSGYNQAIQDVIKEIEKQEFNDELISMDIMLSDE